MNCVVLIVSFIFASFHAYTADMGIQVGSPEFLYLLKQQGVTYNQGYSFVKAFDYQEYPGSHLAVLKTSLENGKVSFQNKNVRYIDTKNLPNPLHACVKPIAQINGYGLFATKDFKKGDVIGIYSGKVYYAPGINAVDREKSRVAISAFLDDNAAEDIEKSGGFSEEIKLKYLGDYNKILSSRYALIMAPHLPSRPDTDYIAIDAQSEGNELRFINHASGAGANCESTIAWMPYWQLLTLSQVNKYIVREVEESEESYIPVILVTVSKDIKMGEQFLFDYGPIYFQRLGITPFDLSRTNASVSPKNICAVCGKEDVDKRCSVCKKSYYCSGECQKKDWPKHKGSCKKAD